LIKKVLIQHPHGTEISGVSTYVQNAQRALEATGEFEVTVVSSLTQSIRERVAAMRHVEYVHLNSNDLPLALAARVAGKSVSIKYHWPFWLSTRYHFEAIGWSARLRRELAYIWTTYVRGRGVRDGIRAYARLAMRLVTFGVVPTRLACSAFTASAVEAGDRVVPVPNPFDFGASSEARVPEGVLPRFVFAGRIVHDKGVDTLVDAAALVMQEGFDFDVIVVGDGEELSALEARAETLGVAGTVRFVGRKQSDELLAIVRSALALVYPARWEDPAPYPPIEAASQCVVSIASRAGGLGETAGPFALYFEREDSRALAESMIAFLEHPAQAVERGNAAARHARSIYGMSAAAVQLAIAIGAVQPQGHGERVGDI